MTENLDFIEGELSGLKRFGLYRSLREVSSGCEPMFEMEGRQVLQFSSNNYLGLSTHPVVKEAAVKAIEKYGTGSGASRLVSGTLDLHGRLEQALARFKGTEAALAYATGSMANMGVIPCLAGGRDVVLLDELDHATLHDGARLSKAVVKIFKHNDMADLERLLQESGQADRRLIAVDGVFSMDGDLAPLPEITGLAKKYKAMTLVDEAHATGVMGATGRGTLEHFGLEPGSVDVQVGTLSKALGSLGGFAACSTGLRDLLVNKSRSFLFATALPAASAAAALAAIELIEKDSGPRLKLWENRRQLWQGLDSLGAETFGSVTPILPLKVGRPEKTLAVQKSLWDLGLYVPGIRPPTVPKDSSRLRISLMATHEGEQINRLLQGLEAALEAVKA